MKAALLTLFIIATGTFTVPVLADPVVQYDRDDYYRYDRAIAIMIAITTSIPEIVTGSIIIVTTVVIARRFLSSSGASKLLRIGLTANKWDERLWLVD